MAKIVSANAVLRGSDSLSLPVSVTEVQIESASELTWNFILPKTHFKRLSTARDANGLGGFAIPPRYGALRRDAIGKPHRNNGGRRVPASSRSLLAVALKNGAAVRLL